MGIKSQKEYKEGLERIIRGSSLIASQKNLWFDFLNKVDIGIMSPIWQALQEDKSQLDVLTKNLEEKLRGV